MPILSKTVQQTFRKSRLIDFLQWGELDVKECAEKLGTDPNLKRIAISPDVHSLHIAWEEPGEFVCHEIADWPCDDVTMKEFLSDEIGDDCWDSHEDTTLDDMIPDYGGEIKKISLSELGVE